MKKFFSKSAYTLIELIVSLALVSIVVLGIVSIDMVLNNNGQDFGQRYVVRSSTQSSLNHILNNAALAVGSVNTDDESIILGGTHGLVDPNTFCIHQPGGAGNNIINNAGDIWLCYTWTNTLGYPFQINWCAETYAGPGADPRGSSSCFTSGSLIPNPATGASITFLGSAFSMVPTFTPAAGLSMTLTNRLNNAAAASPSTNPQTQVSGNAFPSQSSTG